MRIDRDGQLAVPEADVERTCVDWLLLRWPGAQYIRTDASDLRRGGSPAFVPYTLDGVFVHPTKPPLFVEWKRRLARTAKRRRDGQAATATRLADLGFLVIRTGDDLKDPIQWFMDRADGW